MSTAIHNISARLTDEEKRQLDELVAMFNTGIGKASQAEVIRHCIRTIHTQEMTKGEPKAKSKISKN